MKTCYLLCRKIACKRGWRRLQNVGRFRENGSFHPSCLVLFTSAKQAIFTHVKPFYLMHTRKYVKFVDGNTVLVNGIVKKLKQLTGIDRPSDRPSE